jgi:hypothetical protein
MLIKWLLGPNTMYTPRQTLLDLPSHMECIPRNIDILRVHRDSGSDQFWAVRPLSNYCAGKVSVHIVPFQLSFTMCSLANGDHAPCG